MLRINTVNFKKEPDDKPSALYSLFTHNMHRDIISRIAAYATADDLTHVKMSSKAAYFNINKWLDATFSNPDRLLGVLAKLDKLQISKLLQKYFSYGSPYLEKLKAHVVNQNSPAAYICCALVADVNALIEEDLIATLNWMRENHIAQHLISSISFILEYAFPRDDDLEGDEIIELHPDAYLNLHGLDLRGQRLRYLDLRGANLQHTLLNRSSLGESNLSGASLQYAVMKGCDAYTANFSGANLQFANLNDALLGSANFSHTDLRYASLRHATLTKATLNHAKLQGANLKRAQLNEVDAIAADFSHANLSLCNLQFANLSEASLDHSKLNDTLFFSTDLSHATLNGAIHKPSSMPFTKFTPDNEGEKPSKARRLFY